MYMSMLVSVYVVCIYKAFKDKMWEHNIGIPLASSVQLSYLFI